MLFFTLCWYIFVLPGINGLKLCFFGKRVYSSETNYYRSKSPLKIRELTVGKSSAVLKGRVTQLGRVVKKSRLLVANERGVQMREVFKIVVVSTGCAITVDHAFN